MKVACFFRAAIFAGAAFACTAAQKTVSPIPSPNTLPPAMRAQEKAAMAGLEDPGDVRSVLAGILKDNEQMKPLLASMNPQAWYDKKGAPSAYILQHQTAQRQLNDLLYSAKMLSQKTSDLSLALDTYFRIEALAVTAQSLDHAAHEYGSRANADKLQNLIARNFNSRQKLRDYVRNLAANLEQNFKIADEEAQRCRVSVDARTKRSRR
jgi:hypothetical protein